MRSHSPAKTDSTTAMLGSLKPKKLGCLPKTALVSQAAWNITLVTAENFYSIATFITDLLGKDPYVYGMSKLGMGVGAVGGLALGGSQTYSHWAMGSHFAHGAAHGHSHGGPAQDHHHDLADVAEQEEAKQEATPASTKLTWGQSFSAAFHYLSDAISSTAFPLMAYKTLLSMREDEQPSPVVLAAIYSCSFFCNLQTLLNTRSAFTKENERKAEESKQERRGPGMV